MKERIKPTHFIECYCDGTQSGVLPISIFKTWYQPHIVVAVFKMKIKTSPQTQHKMENEAFSDLDKSAKEQPQLSFGQKAVGLKFNPSGDDAVTKCKQGFADSIDQMDTLRQQTRSQQVARYCSAAITQMEIAQMMAVKAITWKD